MKYIFCFTLLIISIYCNKKSLLTSHSMEEAFPTIKKDMLECISKSEGLTETLKNYVDDILQNDLDEPLNFSLFKLLEGDRAIIRKCKRDSFNKYKNEMTKLKTKNNIILK